MTSQAVDACEDGWAGRVERVGVVIPARNEERLLPRCLDSIATAVTVLAERLPRVHADVVVVLDRCTDGTAQIAADHGVRTVRCDAGAVGVARARGMRAVLSDAGPVGDAAARMWLASTDADSRVPADWLARQVRLAERGVDLVIGTVEPADADPVRTRRWARAHTLGEGHPHVHGANLGIRASTYLAVGGFAPLRLHEDVLLAEAVKRAGHRWLATDTTRVSTSGRLRGRAAGGFAAYLHGLGDDGQPTVAVRSAGNEPGDDRP